jgi:hypothetical protein
MSPSKHADAPPLAVHHPDVDNDAKPAGPVSSCSDTVADAAPVAPAGCEKRGSRHVRTSPPLATSLHDDVPSLGTHKLMAARPRYVCTPTVWQLVVHGHAVSFEKEHMT